MKQELKSKPAVKAHHKKPKLVGSTFKQNEKLNLKFDDLGLGIPKSPLAKQKLSNESEKNADMGNQSLGLS